VQTLVDYNYDPVHSICIIFSKMFVEDHKICMVVKFPPHRTYVATIPCETVTHCDVIAAFVKSGFTNEDKILTDFIRTGKGYNALVVVRQSWRSLLNHSGHCVSKIC